MLWPKTAVATLEVGRTLTEALECGHLGTIFQAKNIKEPPKVDYVKGSTWFNKFNTHGVGFLLTKQLSLGLWP